MTTFSDALKERKFVQLQPLAKFIYDLGAAMEPEDYKTVGRSIFTGYKGIRFSIFVSFDSEKRLVYDINCTRKVWKSGKWTWDVIEFNQVQFDQVLDLILHYICQVEAIEEYNNVD